MHFDEKFVISSGFLIRSSEKAYREKNFLKHKPCSRYLPVLQVGFFLQKKLELTVCHNSIKMHYGLFL